MTAHRCDFCGHRETTQERRRREGLCLRCGTKTEFVSWLDGAGRLTGYHRSLCPEHLEQARQYARARKAAKSRPETNSNTPQEWDKSA